MQAVRVELGHDDLAAYIGAVVAANVRGVGSVTRALKKGHMLRAEDLPALQALAQEQPDLTVPLLVPGADDVHEDDAAARLGQWVAGPGIQVRGPAQGKTRLVAATRGLVRVDAAALARLNRVPDMSIYTLFDNQPVDRGTVVAEAKCTPLVVAEARLAEAAQAAGTVGPAYRAVVDVLPFRPVCVAMLIRERLEDAARERVRAVLVRKLDWFGATLLDGPLGYVSMPDAEDSVAARLHDMLAAGADLILTAGGSLSDPFDPTLAALERVGAELVLRGLPVHPGSLLWVAYRDAVPILGVPSCGLLSESTSFDIMLPRLLARGRDAVQDVADLSLGGLLASGMDYRFPSYGASSA